MRAIFESLPGLIDELPNDEAREAVVFAVWPAVIGEQLKNRSVPLSFADGTLTAAVTDLGWKREFREHAPEILYKLNRTFGRSIVERIVPVVDERAVEHSKRRSGIDVCMDDLEPPEHGGVTKAAAGIADLRLRQHFLEAAAACIARRDAS